MPDPVKWTEAGGNVKVHADGSLTYVSADGNAVRYTQVPRLSDPVGVWPKLAPQGANARTNAQLIQEIAERAEAWGVRKGLGTGPVLGTLKHAYADELLTRYQRMFGSRGLSTEVRFLNGVEWKPGMPVKGSIRLDVVEVPTSNPTWVWDYKFGGAKLSPARINQIRSGAGLGPNVPDDAVRP